MSVTVSSVSKGLGISVEDCKPLIKSITDRFPDIKIVSVKKEGDDFIFTLLGDIVVKFSPPYSFPIISLPHGFSRCNSDDLAFDLFSHLGKSKHLFTTENLSLLKKIPFKYGRGEKQTNVYSDIARAFAIPSVQCRTPALLITLVKKIPAIVDRILIIDKKKIKVGIKVILENDNREYRVVKEVKPNFYLRLSGTNTYIDPEYVSVIKD